MIKLHSAVALKAVFLSGSPQVCLQSNRAAVPPFRGRPDQRHRGREEADSEEDGRGEGTSGQKDGVPSDGKREVHHPLDRSGRLLRGGFGGGTP